MSTRTITGYLAVTYALAMGTRLHKYTDPTEGPREVTVAEACELIRVDPSLVHTEVVVTAEDLERLTQGADPYTAELARAALAGDLQAWDRCAEVVLRARVTT